MSASVVNGSFSRFLYPFTFDPATYDSRIAALRDTALSGAWRPGSFPTADLLSHVRRYLEPADASTACLFFSQSAPSHAWAFPPGMEWTAIVPAGDGEPDRPLAFRFCAKPEEPRPDANSQRHAAAELALFRTGVGFLILHATPGSVDPGDWLDFLHRFRYVNRLSRCQVSSDGKLGHALQREIDQAASIKAGPGWPGHLGGHVGLVGHLIYGLLRGAAVAGRDPWWEDIYVPGHLLPYTGILVDNLDPADAPALQYNLRNFFHARQTNAMAITVRDPGPPSMLEYAENHWFMVSLDGTAYLGVNAPDVPFFRQNMLCDHVRNIYSLLNLLCLAQRFTLMRLSHEVAERWPLKHEPADALRREELFRSTRDDLLIFTARGHFAQVMQSDHHHRFYKACQQVYETDQLYAEVRDEVAEMYAELRLRQAERLSELQEAENKRAAEAESAALVAREEQARLAAEAEKKTEAAREEQALRIEDLSRRQALLISLVGVVIGAPAIAFSFFGMNIRKLTSTDGISLAFARQIAAGSAVVGLALALTIVFIAAIATRIRRRSKGN